MGQTLAISSSNLIWNPRGHWKLILDYEDYPQAFGGFGAATLGAEIQKEAVKNVEMFSCNHKPSAEFLVASKDYVEKENQRAKNLEPPFNEISFPKWSKLDENIPFSVFNMEGQEFVMLPSKGTTSPAPTSNNESTISAPTQMPHALPPVHPDTGKDNLKDNTFLTSVPMEEEEENPKNDKETVVINLLEAAPLVPNANILQDQIDQDLEKSLNFSNQVNAKSLEVSNNDEKANKSNEEKPETSTSQSDKQNFRSSSLPEHRKRSTSSLLRNPPISNAEKPEKKEKNPEKNKQADSDGDEENSLFPPISQDGSVHQKSVEGLPISVPQELLLAKSYNVKRNPNSSLNSSLQHAKFVKKQFFVFWLLTNFFQQKNSFHPTIASIKKKNWSQIPQKTKLILHNPLERHPFTYRFEKKFIFFSSVFDKKNFPFQKDMLIQMDKELLTN